MSTLFCVRIEAPDGADDLALHAACPDYQSAWNLFWLWRNAKEYSDSTFWVHHDGEAIDPRKGAQLHYAPGQNPIPWETTKERPEKSESSP